MSEGKEVKFKKQQFLIKTWGDKQFSIVWVQLVAV